MKKQVIAVGSRFTRLVDGFPVRFEVMAIDPKMVVEFRCKGERVKNPEISRQMHASYFGWIMALPKQKKKGGKA